MADWYVDSSATGTNSGTSPTNAAIDINSLTFGGTVQWGDRVWVRRTMAWQANSFIAAMSGYNPYSHAPLEIIGWPSSGDPHYEDRPSAGASAWDGDAALYSNLPWPVLATSGTNGQAMFTLGNGHYLTNFLFVSSTALSRIISFENNFGDIGGAIDENKRAGKLAFLNVHCRAQRAMYCDEIVYCGSGLAGNVGCTIGAMRRFTICTSFVGEPLFPIELFIGDIINQSNSVAFWAISSIGNFTYDGSFIGNISGNDVTNPTRPFATVGANDYRTPVIVGNYLGRGPAIWPWTGGAAQISAAVGSTAVYSGAPTTQINVMSNATNKTEIANYNYDDVHEHIGQAISVQSGTRVTAKFFFRHVGVGSLEANRLGWIQLTGLGGGRKALSQQTASGGIYADPNAALWTGASVAIGSAYYGQGIWTPTETTTAYLFARAPIPLGVMNPASMQMYVACFMEVTTG